ncbi:hypothetical protein FF1_018336 [Malus domestica]
MWVERSKKSIFIYQDTSKKDPFLPGIQTEWQLQQMIRFGHRNLIAVDSTFGIKRLKWHHAVGVESWIRIFFSNCAWSMQGNLCKHVIKINMICEGRQGYQPSISSQSFEDIMMNLLNLDQSMAWTMQMLNQHEIF